MRGAPVHAEIASSAPRKTYNRERALESAQLQDNGTDGKAGNPCNGKVLNNLGDIERRQPKTARGD